MDHEWQPVEAEAEAGSGAEPTMTERAQATSPVGPDHPGPRPAKPRGLRRLLATLGLTIGMLAIGGASVAMAASPSPSSTPSASSGTTTPTPKHNCPNMGSHGGSMQSPTSTSSPSG